MRYQDEHQYYHFDSTTDVIVECNAESQFMNRVPKLGISAGSVYVNGVPIVNDGCIHVPAIHVEHRPKEGDRGLIDVISEHPL